MISSTTVRVSIAACIALCVAGIFGCSTLPRGGGGPDQVTVPMVIEGNRVFVDLSFRKPDGTMRIARFQVDTGGGSFLLTEQLARDIGLSWGETTTEEGATLARTTSTPAASIKGFPLQFDSDRVLVVVGRKNLLPAVSPGSAEGLLPGYVLAHYHVIFDYPNGTFTLARPNTLKPVGAAQPMTVSTRQGFPRTEIEIDGEPHGFLLDTGSSITIVSERLTREWRQRHKDWESHPGVFGEASTFGGSVLETMFVPDARWAGYRLGRFAVVAQREGVFENWMSQMMTAPIEGSLGGNVLHDYRLELDYPNQKLYVSTSYDCSKDLDFTAQFVLANDAGIHALGWTEYPAESAAVLRQEQQIAKTVASPNECAASIARFLQSVRKGHLEVAVSGNAQDLLGKAEDVPRASLRRMHDGAIYLDVPSFGPGMGEQLSRLVKANRKELRGAKRLIIDLRRNGGGSDSEYGPLLRLLGPATYRTEYPQIYATSANIQSWEVLTQQLTNDDQKKWAQDLIVRMKAGVGGWVPMLDAPYSEERYGPTDVDAAPRVVAIFVGPRCASSCEQFVLAAHQNPRVTLIGQRTFGALDASNLRPVATPSGKLAIAYATTYVRRPAGQEIDRVGIKPDLEVAADDLPKLMAAARRLH